MFQNLSQLKLINSKEEKNHFALGKKFGYQNGTKQFDSLACTCTMDIDIHHYHGHAPTPWTRTTTITLDMHLDVRMCMDVNYYLTCVLGCNYVKVHYYLYIL